MTLDFDALARAYWTVPYAEYSDDDQPWDTINDLLDGADEETLVELLRAMALSAPDERVPYVGTFCIEDLEFRFTAEGLPGKPISILLETGLDPALTLRVLSGVYPDMLERMGASDLLAGHLSSAQIIWLIDPRAPGRGASL